MKYIGPGFLIGIPDTDLTDDDIKDLAEKRGQTPAQLRKDLLDSGLYADKKDEPKK